MTDEKMFIPEPMPPCAQCVENPVYGSEEFVMVWCDHRKYGGLYFPITGAWHISGPFQTDVEFRRSLAHTLANMSQARH